MASWDVFHSDRLELVRGLSAEEVRAGVASGAIRDDDLARPSGTSTAWVRVAEVPELIAPPPPAAAPETDAAPSPDAADDLSFPVLDTPAPAAPRPAWDWDDDEEVAEDEDGEEEDEGEEDEEEGDDDEAGGIEPDGPPAPRVREAEVEAASWDLGDDDLDLDRPSPSASSGSRVALPTARSRDYDDRTEDLEDEDDEDGGLISLTRSGPPKVEELDLAAMVDVAFQLVLFFLVTATTILYKSLEIPKPSGEAPPEAVAQGRNKTLDELQDDYILIEIDPEGNVRIDREPVAARLEDLAERLRVAREKTDRRTMLLSADFATPHRSAVLAYDAANEIGLGIAIAKPPPPQGPRRPSAPPRRRRRRGRRIRTRATTIRDRSGCGPWSSPRSNARRRIHHDGCQASSRRPEARRTPGLRPSRSCGRRAFRLDWAARNDDRDGFGEDDERARVGGRRIRRVACGPDAVEGRP
ncbi:ExbD/TolR family protein [Planctomyces sp. SH-PL62]|uniref:ExbD/TolR family protein n=1 Tax=Planctomyces sp. SH-PL62 TaxID=1636152 RepID=UPI000837CC54|nr:biopolymer transporter ExbD [Planctomyces sp. SH-PL62]